MLKIVRLSLAVAAMMAIGRWTTAAEETPLSFFASDVDVVIRLREPDQTFEKLIGLANQIQPGAGDQIKAQQDAILGRMISNPTLTGVDQSRDWYAGVYTHSDSPPTVVFAIPAVKSEDFKSALGEDVASEVKDRWVIYTDAKSIPQADRASSVAGQLEDADRELLTQGDLCLYINIDHLTTVYADQIELAKDKVLEALNQLRFLPQQNGINLDAIANIYGSFAEAYFQGLDDARSSIVSIALADDEIAVEKRVTFAEESKAAQFLAKNPQSEMPLLEKLPAGNPVYFGVNGDARAFMKATVKFSQAIFSTGRKSDQLDETLNELDDIHFGAMVSTTGIADSTEGVLRSVNVVSADPIDKVRDFNRKVVELTGTIQTPALQQTVTVTTDAETYGQYKGDLVTIKQEFEESADPNGIQEKFQQFLMGGDEIETRFVYMDNMYASASGGGQKAMKDLISDLESSKSNGLGPIREKLMDKANLLLFLDLPDGIGKLLSAASEIEGFPLQVNRPMIESLNLKKSYISLAIGSDKNVLRSELHVPVEQIIGTVKLGVLISGSMRPGF